MGKYRLAGISRYRQCRTFTGTLNLGIATLAEGKVRFRQGVKFDNSRKGISTGYGRPATRRWIASGTLPVGFRPAALFLYRRADRLHRDQPFRLRAGMVQRMANRSIFYGFGLWRKSENGAFGEQEAGEDILRNILDPVGIHHLDKEPAELRYGAIG